MWEVVTSKTKPDFSWRYTAKGQEATDASDYRGNSVLQRKRSPHESIKHWIGCPQRFFGVFKIQVDNATSSPIRL